MAIDTKHLEFLSLLRKSLAFIHYDSTNGKTKEEIRKIVGLKTDEVIKWLLDGGYVKEESGKYKINQLERSLGLIRDIDSELFQSMQIQLQQKMVKFDRWLVIVTALMTIATAIIAIS